MNTSQAFDIGSAKGHRFITLHCVSYQQRLSSNTFLASFRVLLHLNHDHATNRLLSFAKAKAQIPTMAFNSCQREASFKFPFTTTCGQDVAYVICFESKVALCLHGILKYSSISRVAAHLLIMQRVKTLRSVFLSRKRF